MKVTLEKLPASQVGFELEVEGQKSQAIYDRAVQKLVKTAEVPGFRKGKAPKQLILRQFGTAQLKASVLEDLIEESLTQALKDHQDQVKPIGQFQMRSPIEEIVANFEIGKPLTFQAAIDVAPEVTVKNYQGFVVKAEKIEPKLELVDKMLLDFQVRRATLVPVEDRPAQTDDVVTVDYTLTDVETDLLIPDQSVEGETFSLDQDSDFDENIVDAIIGMSIGETKQVPADLDPEYWDEPMGGKSVIYTITLKEIKGKELPALDDEFAQAISEKQTMTELREFLDQREVDAATQKTKFNLESALLDALAAETEVDMPQTLIDEEINFLIRQQMSFLGSQPAMRAFVNQLFTRENMPQIVETARPEAISRIKRSLAVAELGKQLDIKVSREELDDRIKSTLEELEDASKIDQNRMSSMLESGILGEKVLQWLTENSEVEYVAEGSLPKEEALYDEDFEYAEGSVTVESETVQEMLPSNSGEQAIDVQAEVVTAAEVISPILDNQTQENPEQNPEQDSELDAESADSSSIDPEQPEAKAKSKKAKK
jgi:trigger factor